MHYFGWMIVFPKTFYFVRQSKPTTPQKINNEPPLNSLWKIVIKQTLCIVRRVFKKMDLRFLNCCFFCLSTSIKTFMGRYKLAVWWQCSWRISTNFLEYSKLEISVAIVTTVTYKFKRLTKTRLNSDQIQCQA